MAFEMYFDDHHETIEHHEEFLFALIPNSVIFPELSRLWQAFYDSPTLQPDQANQLVHELIQLLAHNDPGNPVLTRVIIRLLQFFSGAYLSKADIECVSD